MNPSHIYAVKRAISTYAPPLFSAIRYSRQVLHRRRNVRLQSGLTPWKQRFVEKFGFVVQGGPFAGMKFHESSVADAYLPLLTGSYEAETHGFIETALKRVPERIVDVGCDAGYVAVGLALRAPAATVYAFDIRAEARDNCRSLAAANQVAPRVVIGSECTPASLDEICGARSLVFCDCEGYELRSSLPTFGIRINMTIESAYLHSSSVKQRNTLLGSRDLISIDGTRIGLPSICSCCSFDRSALACSI